MQFRPYLLTQSSLLDRKTTLSKIKSVESQSAIGINNPLGMIDINIFFHVLNIDNTLARLLWFVGTYFNPSKKAFFIFHVGRHIALFLSVLVFQCLQNQTSGVVSSLDDLQCVCYLIWVDQLKNIHLIFVVEDSKFWQFISFECDTTRLVFPAGERWIDSLIDSW